MTLRSLTVVLTGGARCNDKLTVVAPPGIESSRLISFEIVDDQLGHASDRSNADVPAFGTQGIEPPAGSKPQAPSRVAIESHHERDLLFDQVSPHATSSRGVSAPLNGARRRLAGLVDQHHLALHGIGAAVLLARAGGCGELEERNPPQIERRVCVSQADVALRKTNVFVAQMKDAFEAFIARFREPPEDGLKVAVVAHGLEAGAAELRRDVFGCEVESAGRGLAPLEQVRCQEREVSAQRIRADPIQCGSDRRRDARRLVGLLPSTQAEQHEGHGSSQKAGLTQSMQLLAARLLAPERVVDLILLATARTIQDDRHRFGSGLALVQIESGLLRSRPI